MRFFSQVPVEIQTEATPSVASCQGNDHQLTEGEVELTARETKKHLNAPCG
jgi:hypothetical protein